MSPLRLSRSAPPPPFQPSPIELERRRYRQGQGRRATLIALLSTVGFAALAWFIIAHSPGWADVRSSFFDPSEFVRSLPKILAGLWVNLRVLLFTLLGVSVLATVIAIVKTTRSPALFPLRVLAAAYTDLFRGRPVIILLYLVGFGIPGLNLFEKQSAAVWGTIALTLTYSAYVAEVIRAGIEAVHPSQLLAAQSLGLSHRQTLRLILLPQALRKMTPALMNDFVSLQKDVGLISVLGAVDAVRAAQTEVSLTYNFTPYVVAGLIFVALSFPVIRLTDWVTARVRRREQAGRI